VSLKLSPVSTDNLVWSIAGKGFSFGTASAVLRSRCTTPMSRGGLLKSGTLRTVSAPLVVAFAMTRPASVSASILATSEVMGPNFFYHECQEPVCGSWRMKGERNRIQCATAITADTNYKVE
jgi:hypothetical protein